MAAAKRPLVERGTVSESSRALLLALGESRLKSAERGDASVLCVGCLCRLKIEEVLETSTLRKGSWRKRHGFSGSRDVGSSLKSDIESI